MAIQMRRGANADFDVNKMLPGEIAVTTDGTRKVYAAFKAGDAKELASKEDIQALVDETQDANKSAMAAANTAITKANEALASSQNTDQKAQEALESAERAKMHAENASAVTGVHIATEDTAGLMKGGENTVDEDGTLVMLRKVSGNNLVLNDSYKGALRINKVFGKSTQDGVPTPEAPVPIVNAGQKLAEGWQLFDIDSAAHAYIQSDGAVIDNANNLISDYIDVKDMDITISTNAIIQHIDYACYDGEKTFIKTVGANNVKTINVYKDSAVCYIRAWFNIDNHELGDRLLAYEPMINYGTTAKPWEPYTGGVKAVYDVGIGTEVLGKNLIDARLNVQISGNDAYDILHGQCANKKFTIKLKQTCAVFGDGKAQHQIYFHNKAGEVIKRFPFCRFVFSSVNEVLEEIFTFTTTSDTYYIRVDLGTFFQTNTRVMTLACQLELGSTATDYEPYKPKQSLPINTPNGLPGIEVTDASLANYIDADGRMWVCDTREWDRGVDVKRIFTRKFENITESNIKLRTSVDGYTEAEIYGNSKMVSGFGLCDSFKYKPTGASVRFAVYYETVFFTLLGEFNTKAEWLEEFNRIAPTIHAILATPIETPIPEEEMAAWRAMHSNEPTTTILSDADVEVEYPTSRVGAVALDADMRSRENEKEIDELESSILDTIAEVEANEEEKKIAGALALKAYMQYVINNFLPLTGGTLSGNLATNGGMAHMWGNAAETVLTNTVGDNYAYISVSEADELAAALKLIKAGRNTYKIFGEHNKPSGSYTGNGSATARTINIGGIGAVLLVIGKGALTFVINGAAWSFKGSTMPVLLNGISFSDGVLTLSTTDIYVNDSGTAFYYQVL